ncbi:hypothetical protein MLD38_031143 [Melastoma candidum]|uniref:Uncharacterized protein n=1 Tax=Melastoma candidum TaxID=119954 RepID=A0ACB9MNU4_9MYRT|nr:hypothetical protein MLD38_031143 [Melastoma candidum]
MPEKGRFTVVRATGMRRGKRWSCHHEGTPKGERWKSSPGKAWSLETSGASSLSRNVRRGLDRGLEGGLLRLGRDDEEDVSCRHRFAVDFGDAGESIRRCWILGVLRYADSPKRTETGEEDEGVCYCSCCCELEDFPEYPCAERNTLKQREGSPRR